MRLARAIRRFGRRNDGSTVVQFAFVAPIVILFSLGIIDMGRLLWMDATIGFAADEGGRYASIHGINGNFPNPPASESDVRNYMGLSTITLDKTATMTVL
jgi:Flp pilus assembly protein TadG